VQRIVVIGGGPAGYEAALVARQYGAAVTVIERDGAGGACVLTDCVPSKTLIASASGMTAFTDASELGIRLSDAADGAPVDKVTVDLAVINRRVRRLAQSQSGDIRRRLVRDGVEVLTATAHLVAPHQVRVAEGDDIGRVLEADAVLLATGATPRVLEGSEPDGERILSWRELYALKEIPEHLVVIGSGVTGAEFASAYLQLGSQVTLVSSRDRVLPGGDEDAALQLEEVLTRRGMTILKHARAEKVRRDRDGVVVELADGRTVIGSHALVAVGVVPNTSGIGLEDVGVAMDRGFVTIDKVARTNVAGVYAAGDCTGVLMLASVAAMQGRTAMWHVLGEAVAPIRFGTVSSTIFTDPEIASVGVSQEDVESGRVTAETLRLPLATNARAKMQGIGDGFVKLFARPGSGTVLGGVVVAPRASELILPLSLAVQHGITVGQLAHTFAVYPSLSGSITEAARQLMVKTVTA
jgi:dihydrolipoamide dehydrogenase